MMAMGFFNRHQHKWTIECKLYKIDKDVGHSDISEFGFTRTYRVVATEIYKCECGKRKRENIIDKIFYQHHPFDKEAFMKTVTELKQNGFTESVLL